MRHIVRTKRLLMVKLFYLTFFIGVFGMGTAVVDTNIVADWNFVKEENGVKLYNRAIEGFEYKEVKAVLSMDFDMDKAKHYLMEPSNIEKWMSGCSMSVEKKNEGTAKEYYAIFDAPWPVSDRDDYGRLEIKEDTESTLKIDFESKPNGTPKVSNMVRVPFSKGHIKIEKLPSGAKVLTYQFLVDRGGSLPGYLKDYLETSSPLNTVNKLRDVLEKL